MKNTSLPIPVLIAVLFGTMLFSGTSEAQQCKSEKVTLKINEHALWLKPDGLPKCLFVSDFADVNVTFSIGLKTQGPYQLRDGQVHVRQVPIKVVGNVELPCGEELEFAAAEYTNVGENDIIVNVVGTNVPEGDVICYEIVVDDVGTIDPRARVEQGIAMQVNFAELSAIINAHDVLAESALGDTVPSGALDAYTQESYGMTEAQAREAVQKYRE